VAIFCQPSILRNLICPLAKAADPASCKEAEEQHDGRASLGSEPGGRDERPPRLRPGITQGVAPNDSQRALKPKA